MCKCDDCIFRWKMYSSQRQPCCAYTLDTGLMRVGSVDDCLSYCQGNPHRRHKLIFSENYFH